MIKTIQVRVKDKHAKVLRQMAFDVNQVWNAANNITSEYASVPIPGFGWVKTPCSDYDIQKELVGIRKERGLNIGSATCQRVINQHAKARIKNKKNKLRWRCSSGSKRSLGWVPFKTAGIKYVNGQIRFCGYFFSLWDSYGLKNYQLRTGSFSEDCRGRWYFNATVEIEPIKGDGKSAIAIDLGLKTIATCSDGTVLSNERIYRGLENKLAVAQRANKHKLIKSIHAKIKNKRKDVLHKFSSALVSEHGAIFVGDVSSSKLAKTRMAKSVLDAGWFMLKTQLKYKANARSVVYEEVDERYTSQTCSSCFKISSNSPKGRKGLGIREWTCAECGTTHDRDINAAKNILRLGHQALAGGISTDLNLVMMPRSNESRN